MNVKLGSDQVVIEKGNTAIDRADSLLDDYTETELTLPPKSVLNDYEKFFEWSGGVLHPKRRDRAGRPVRILKPFWYQTKFANMGRGVLLGSNKLAKTKGELINDIRTRLMPEHAGFDMLLVGQTQMMADEHLLNAKKWMLQSQNLRPFLITRPDQRFRLPEEKSKMKMMYIENPYEPENPSRIISIGFSESMAYSWEKIDRLHISDPGQNTRKSQLSFFSGLYSRLSNTEGDIKIEGVASQRTGYFWELCKQLFPEKFSDVDSDMEDTLQQKEKSLEELETMSGFERLFLTADDGVKVKIISKEWLQNMRNMLPKEEFERIYYCRFSKQQGTIFDDIKRGDFEPLGAADILEM